MSFWDRMGGLLTTGFSSEPPKRQATQVWGEQAGSLNNSPQMPPERTYMDARFVKVRKSVSSIFKDPTVVEQVKARDGANRGFESAFEGGGKRSGMAEIFKNYGCEHGKMKKEDCPECMKK